MTHIALNDAQQKLPELIAAVGRGEEFVITMEGKPVAKVSPTTDERPARVFGSMKGQIWMSDDFDAPLDDFAEYM